jgi:exosortase/archaeosortase family protein
MNRSGAGWLCGVFAALWPVWQWSAGRFLDGSDEPWGIVAIAALGLFLFRDRAAFAERPRTGWLLAAAAATCAAILTSSVLPPLARGVFASLAVTAVLMAVRRARHPMLPYGMLALLSLPVLSSLQFYLGYPLRVLTAAASAVLLSALGFDAERAGSALTVDGTLVIVDAPCAGIHMAWAAYFTAACAAAWLRLDSRRFLFRMAPVSAIVIGLNVLRNTVLVALESRASGLDDGWHEAVGAVAFVVVCLATLRQVRRGLPRRERWGELELFRRAGLV